MSKITIILKSGRELHFEADSISITRHTITGTVMDYTIKGVKNGEVPISLSPDEIYCVTQIYDESEDEEVEG